MPYCLFHELSHDKTNKMTCVLKQDSEKPWHLCRLIRIFVVVHLEKNLHLNLHITCTTETDCPVRSEYLCECGAHVILLFYHAVAHFSDVLSVFMFCHKCIYQNLRVVLNPTYKPHHDHLSRGFDQVRHELICSATKSDQGF